jgi:hypothetical protein
MKSPGRVIDGPYAAWGAYDEAAQVVLASGATLVVGQPLCLDLTNLGPDNNIPNNGAALAQCERLVATTSANAGPVFGVFTGFPNGAIPSGVALTVSGGLMTYTNNNTNSVTAAVNVKQSGWGYVYAGTASSSPAAISVNSSLIISSSYAYAIAGTAAILKTVGTALATAVNTSSSAAVATGSHAITPASMVGITTTTALLIDSLQSGVQETVTPSAVTSTTFTATFANAHAANFAITGAQKGASGTLIAANNSITGLVAAYITVNV